MTPGVHAHKGSNSVLLLLLRSKQLSKAKLDKTYRYVRQTAKKTTFITFATYVFV